jgi:hypothetical protein
MYCAWMYAGRSLFSDRGFWLLGWLRSLAGDTGAHPPDFALSPFHRLFDSTVYYIASGLVAIALFLGLVVLQRFRWGLIALRYVGPGLIVYGPLYFHRYFRETSGTTTEWVKYLEVAVAVAVVFWFARWLRGRTLVIATVVVGCLHVTFWDWVIVGFNYGTNWFYLRVWGIPQLVVLMSWAIWMQSGPTSDRASRDSIE